MQPTLIDQGLDLMLYGMGTVFVFLTILVFATSLMSLLVNRLASNQGTTNSGSNDNIATDSTQQPDPQVLAAIKAAISQHRQT